MCNGFFTDVIFGIIKVRLVLSLSLIICVFNKKRGIMSAFIKYTKRCVDFRFFPFLCKPDRKFHFRCIVFIFLSKIICILNIRLSTELRRLCFDKFFFQEAAIILTNLSADISFTIQLVVLIL